MVRLHRFADLDDDAVPGTPTGRLPSYRSMIELAREDKAVSDILAREAFESAVEDFAEDGDKDAAMELGRCEGEKLSAHIVRLALRAFGITARTNTITGRAEIRGMPNSFSKENAANTLPVYLMDKLRCIGVKGATKTATNETGGIK